MNVLKNDFADEIMEDPTFSSTLERLAVQTDQPIAQVREEARKSLHELAAEQHDSAVSTWDKLCKKASKAYQIDVDDEQIERLKKLNETKTLVFLPNHRSYLDPLIIRWSLKQHDFPPNHTLGGVNLAFWPLGPIARRNGIIFIRREFKDAPVYKAALGAYLAYLVRKRENLEWYIEGGRTRTGKLRPPRMGLLSYLIDAFVENAQPGEDIALVPTFIGYDQQYEVAAISAEEQGAKKTPESVKWFFNFFRAQRKSRGAAHLRFGEPLSVRDALAESMKESNEKGESEDRRARLAVPKMAFEISHRINTATPVMPTALVAYATLDNDGRALTVNEGRTILSPLISYIQARGLDIANDVDLYTEGTMAEAVETLENVGVLKRYSGGSEPVFWVPDDKLHEAAFYRNTLIHFLVTRSIAELSVLKASEDEAENLIDSTWEQALKLRDLLKYEFFFATKREFSEELQMECDLALPNWRNPDFSHQKVVDELKSQKLLVTHRVLESFLSAYSILAQELVKRDVQKPIDKDSFISSCIGVAQQSYLQQTLKTPEAISKDFFLNAYQLADNRNLIDPGGVDVQRAREAFAAEIADFHRIARKIADLAKESRSDRKNA